MVLVRQRHLLKRLPDHWSFDLNYFHADRFT